MANVRREDQVESPGPVMATPAEEAYGRGTELQIFLIRIRITEAQLSEGAGKNRKCRRVIRFRRENCRIRNQRLVSRIRIQKTE